MRYTFIILLVALLAGASWGATIQVPTDYPTIQQAITVASAGDTIQVSPGTYYGSITIDKPLIVKSTGGPEVTILDGNHVGEHYYMVQINSNDVVLDGFTITNPIYNRTADAAGVVIGSSGRNSNIRITNCIIHDIGVPDRDPVSFGTFGINCGPVDGLEIDHCIIHGIHNGSPTQSAFGIFTWGNNESDTTANISIHDNLIYDISSPSESNAGIHTGFYGSNISIKNNTIIANNECEAGITISKDTLGPVEIVNNKITGGTVAGIRLHTPQPANVVLNTINDASTGILVEDRISDDLLISYNHLSGNIVGLKNLVEATVPAEKNWWGSAGGPGSAGSTIILGSVDTDPCLKTPSIHLAYGGNRLAGLQRYDGGWAWPLEDPSGKASPVNTIGPIGMGLAKAYQVTGDLDMYSALVAVSEFLKSKTDNFSPTDGYLAAELDRIFGTTEHVAYMNQNFYGPLSAGTYKRSGDTITEYTTEEYIQYLRDRRTGKNINLPAWDLGMGIVGARLCGVDVSPWVEATKAEIEELNSNEDFYVLGLAGALYGLAFVGEEFDPTDGPFADANNLTDLANILVDFQQADGSFIRSIIKPNSSVQETAYAMLALNEFGCFGEEVGKAAAYLRSVQLSTGGWENGIDETGENNEYSAEALWALSLVNVLVLNVPVESLYVKPGETVDVELYQTNMADAAAGYQAFLSFDTGKLSIDTGNITHTPDPYGWLHYTKVTGGNIDLSAGIRMEYTDPGQDPQQPSSATAKLATLQFTAIGVAGATNTTTNVAFRPNYPPTRFTIDGYELPTLTYDSLTITIDGIDPAVTVTAPNGGEWFKGGDIFNITWDAADDYLADKPIRIEYDNGTGLVLIAANEENDGTYEWTVPTGVNINTAKIRVSATDKAGNIGFDESDSSFVIDNTAPVITEPVDISVPADAGKSTAIVDVEWPTVVDNFDDNPTVTGVRDDGKDLDDPYPVGTTKITWTATDKVGNTSTAEQTVVVLTIAKMDVEVYLDGDITGTFTRPITFVIGGEGGGPVGPMTLVKNVEFTDGFGTVELDVPANGVWTVISAKDEKHTLRKQVEVTIPDGSTRYFATFESNTLTGGDLTNDNMIDILDFSVLVSQYGTSGGTVRDANINGDLKVDTGDFTFIQINFLKVGEAEPSKSAGPVTAPPANGSTSVKARKAVEAANIGLSNVVSIAPAPRTAVSVRELKSLGIENAELADMNKDGIVNATDIMLFMNTFGNMGKK